MWLNLKKAVLFFRSLCYILTAEKLELIACVDSSAVILASELIACVDSSAVILASDSYVDSQHENLASDSHVENQPQ